MTNNFKIDYRLLLVFLAIAIQILVMSYSTYKGGLTADSKNYLNLAQNILDGHGFLVQDYYSETGRSYFAAWPVGYSVLIAGVAKIFPVDLVLASKLVNILLIGIILLIFKRIFKAEAYIFGSLFLLDSVMKLTYRTWVQTPFMTGMVVLAFLLFYFYHNRQSMLIPIGIIVACIFMFLSRYIGLTSLIAVAILGCYLFYKRDYRSFFVLAVTGFAALGFAIFYFYLNHINAGHITGIERIASPEDTFWMIKRLLLRLLEEGKIVFIAWALVIISIKIFKIKPTKTNASYKTPDNLCAFCTLVALTYLTTIIILRFMYRFDDFGSRMFAPATLLFFIALLDYLHRKGKYYDIFKKCLIVTIIGSFIYNVPYKSYRSFAKGKPTYLEHRSAQEEKYSKLQHDSIVLFGNYDLIYLKNRVQPAAGFPFYGDHIYGKPYNGDLKEDIGPQESLKSYVEKRCKLGISAIYVDSERWKHLRNTKSDGGYEEIDNFLKKYPNNPLPKLADCN